MLQQINDSYLLSKNFGPVVQLVRMPACHAGGRGFESRPDRQIFSKKRFDFKKCIVLIYKPRHFLERWAIAKR